MPDLLQAVSVIIRESLHSVTYRSSYIFCVWWLKSVNSTPGRRKKALGIEERRSTTYLISSKYLLPSVATVMCRFISSRTCSNV